MARIDGKAQFTDAVFSSQATFLDARIGRDADFPGAQFGAEARFGRLHVAGDLSFGESQDPNKGSSRFAGPANFAELRANGLVFKGSHFDDTAIFERMHLDQVLQFLPAEQTPVIFKGLASFGGTTVQGQVVFIRTSFEAEAIFLNATFYKEILFAGVVFEKETSFDRAVIGTTAQFCASGNNPVRFLAGARFHGVRVNGDSTFAGVQFCGDASFDGFCAEGSLFFRPDLQVGRPVWFEKRAGFNNLMVKGNAEYQGAQFGGEAHFDGAAFGGAVHFEPGQIGKKKIHTRFKGKTVFVSASFASKAIFSFAKFRSEAQFESARFAVDAHFDGAQFMDKASFAGVEIRGFAFFERAAFRKKLNLVGARFGSAHFGVEGERSQTVAAQATFHGAVDLRGFAYQRILIDWKAALDKQEPFDREPYSRLEAALRSKGEERQANNVYFRRCKEENRRRRIRIKAAWRARVGSPNSRRTVVGESLLALYHGLQGLLFGYGVRPLRLLLCTLVLIGLGGHVFSMPGAVVPTANSVLTRETLSYTQGLGLSMRLFVPVVELPSGEAWKPSPSPCKFMWLERIGLSYQGYATIHRILGTLFIPLLIAVVAGLFYRISASDRPSGS